jgi:transposase
MKKGAVFQGIGRSTMAGVTRAAAHLSVEEVTRRWKHDPRPLYRQRWLIIYQALVDPREAAQIAKHCGVSTTTVHHLISAYNRWGAAAVETPGKGGRRSQYLTVEQEQQFLAPFFAQARVGSISTAAQIKQAFEAQVGHEVAESTIYRVLDRHGWRKLVPRPVHPKADLTEQAAFKKTSPRPSRPPSRPAPPRISDPS